MSAWVCSDAHIDYIVAAAVRFDEHDYLKMPPTEMGALLLRENVRSVLHRYDENTLEAEEVADYAQQIEQYAFTDVTTPTPVAALKLLTSWAYQTCETPDFKATPAWALSEKIKAVLISALPGYGKAPWSL